MKYTTLIGILLTAIGVALIFAYPRIDYFEMEFIIGALLGSGIGFLLGGFLGYIFKKRKVVKQVKAPKEKKAKTTEKVIEEKAPPEVKSTEESKPSSNNSNDIA